ncbi:hypothetical protein RM530_00710 [Algiphilus sp. W345]|uniref:Uncharacterized protein n=1 Tax=Banduia mediterranea TaxID=3075609 RepID=A0ABU2WDD6_9GAMM|nr:hypothetical protein [Algiphilus sp. W345]MDT0495889.1 hypothetical protein [Algiphilus sp. W345]
MTDYILLTALIIVGITAFLDGRLLYRLNRRCVHAREGRNADNRLLRWYAQGFDQPLRLARWLVRINALLLAAALLLQSDPVLVASAAVMLILGVYELRSGSSVARRHLETINVQQRPPASR